MLNDAAKSPTKPRRREIQLNNWNGDDENNPSISQVESALQRARKKVMSSIPKIIQEIHFFGEWDKTKIGKTLLFLQIYHCGFNKMFHGKFMW